MKKANWIVRICDDNYKTIESFIIKNKTVHAAMNDAQIEINKRSKSKPIEEWDIYKKFLKSKTSNYV